MKELQETIYICEICGNRSKKKDIILKCESTPVTHDKNVKPGDVVKITSGEGCGKFAEVTDVFIVQDKNSYHHTVKLIADVLLPSGKKDWGTRILYFDSYDVVGGL